MPSGVRFLTRAAAREAGLIGATFYWCLVIIRQNIVRTRHPPEVLTIRPGKEARRMSMRHSNVRRLGTLPNASGTLTRLAYAHAKEAGSTFDRYCGRRI